MKKIVVLIAFLASLSAISNEVDLSVYRDAIMANDVTVITGDREFTLKKVQDINDIFLSRYENAKTKNEHLNIIFDINNVWQKIGQFKDQKEIMLEIRDLASAKYDVMF